MGLFGDYPTFPNYFRTHKTPLSGGVGKERSLLPAARCRGVQTRHPDARIHFFDTGHFALETHAKDIAAAIRDFFR